MRITDLIESVEKTSDKDHWLKLLKSVYPQVSLARTTDQADVIIAYRTKEHKDQVGYWDPIDKEGEMWTMMDYFWRNSDFKRKEQHAVDF